MLEGVYGCFMTCNVFLEGNSEVSLELQCFTAELITYKVCECDALECKIERVGQLFRVDSFIQTNLDAMDLSS